MRTQEIACTSCGKTAKVNIVDAAGSSSTPCQHCRNMIVVDTDKSGRVEKIHSGCFVATAAFGDPNAPEVLYLTSYRDEVLSTNSLGRLFIRVYYAISPHLATFIAKSSFLRIIARFLIVRPALYLLRVKR
jgi:hypothetical protein